MNIIKRLLTNSILLSTLLTLGMCSNEPESSYPALPSGVLGTGDTMLDRGTACALFQLGSSVDNMIQWEHQSTQNISSDPNLSCQRVTNLFILADKYKMTGVSVYHGNSTYNSFNNEITYIFAEEGSLSITTDFDLVDPFNMTVIDKEGFTKLYSLTPTKSTEWRSKKTGGKEAWENMTNETISVPSATFFIVEESSAKINMLWTLPGGIKKAILTEKASVNDAVNSGNVFTLYKK